MTPLRDTTVTRLRAREYSYQVFSPTQYNHGNFRGKIASLSVVGGTSRSINIFFFPLLQQSIHRCYRARGRGGEPKPRCVFLTGTHI